MGLSESLKDQFSWLGDNVRAPTQRGHEVVSPHAMWQRLAHGNICQGVLVGDQDMSIKLVNEK